ncbi:MAG: aminoglycoside phosphotransferase family protein [Candidatus Methylomirabilales bacterium]
MRNSLSRFRESLESGGRLERIVECIKSNCIDLFQANEVPEIRIVSCGNMRDGVLARMRITIDDKIQDICVKEYRPSDTARENVRQRLQREYNALRVLTQMGSRVGGVRVVKPIGCLYDLNLLVTEEIPGEALHAILKRRGRLLPGRANLSKLQRYCRLSGQWLSAFQEVSRSIETTPYDVRAALDEMRRVVDEESNDLLLTRSMANRVLDWLEKCARELPDECEVSGMHSDFVPSNLIVADDKVVVLDFECFRSGPVYRDAITFLHALDNYLVNPLFSRETIRLLQEEFLSGYKARIKNEDVSLVRMLEVRETLGQINNWSEFGRNKVWGRWSRRRAQGRLTSRLTELLLERGQGEAGHRICGVLWRVV